MLWIVPSSYWLSLESFAMTSKSVKAFFMVHVAIAILYSYIFQLTVDTFLMGIPTIMLLLTLACL